MYIFVHVCYNPQTAVSAYVDTEQHVHVCYNPQTAVSVHVHFCTCML